MAPVPWGLRIQTTKTKDTADLFFAEICDHKRKKSLKTLENDISDTMYATTFSNARLKANLKLRDTTGACNIKSSPTCPLWFCLERDKKY